MMTAFVAAALLLLAVTLVVLAWPLLRRSSSPEVSSRELTSTVYRDKLAELDQDLAAGSLSPADHEQSRNELQRRLLEDSASICAPADSATGTTQSATKSATKGGAKNSASSAADTTAGQEQRSKGLLLSLAATLPIAAIGLYMVIGTPAALEDNPHQQGFSNAEIEKMVGELAARLKAQPDDHRGWAMLGRSYKMMGRFNEAAQAYAMTGPMLDTSAELLVDYADSVAAAADGFNEQSLQLLDKALKLEPNNLQGLWMRGSASFEAGKYGPAIVDWEKLLAALPPESDDARTIQGNLAEAHRRAGSEPRPALGNAAPATPSSTQTPTPTAATSTAATPTAATPGAGRIEGRVELAPELAKQVVAGDVLMVIARPADGNRLPAAVLRVPAAGFPARFTLDDSQAMTEDRKLSGFLDVLVEARVSRKGQAKAEPGDLMGEGVPIRVGTRDAVIRIDRVVQ